MAAEGGRTQGAVVVALGDSGESGRDEVAGRVHRVVVVVVAVELVGKEQTPCSGCRAASRPERAASLDMAIVVRIVGDMLPGVVVRVRMPMP